MQAVILAAGMGSRLKAVTGGKAKALLDVGGRPLILHQLEALADHGVGPVLVIVGYQADEVKDAIGDRAETLVNDRFDETNSLYSLWLARHWIKGPFILLNCDLFFDPQILDLVLDEPGNVLAYDSTSSRGREQTKVAIKQRRVMDLGKDLPSSSARGESLGLLQFDEEGAKAIIKVADSLVRDAQENAWVIEATRAICSQVPIYGINVAGHAWTEIDFPYDLDVARREVWPVIYRGRWRKQVYWKRTRWVAAAALGFAIATAGWATNTRVGPASLNWETVPLAGGEMVRVERNGEAQRWWMVTPDSAVTALVSGPTVVEVRLVFPGLIADSLRYVVAITLDGTPSDWRAFTSTRDTTTRLKGAFLGDRDRIVLTLPNGLHELGIALLAGHARTMVARIRQPEQREDEESSTD
ncbi:MAG: phosphocholine cytidylyltransferase family protein [Gemmatimonadales bacterium]